MYLTRHYIRVLTDSLFAPATNPTLTLCKYTSNSVRHSSSQTRWKQRQKGDYYSKQAKVLELKSRAAFKLLQVRLKAYSITYILSSLLFPFLPYMKLFVVDDKYKQQKYRIRKKEEGKEK